jgi:hypothetical protein
VLGFLCCNTVWVTNHSAVPHQSGYHPTPIMHMTRQKKVGDIDSSWCEEACRVWGAQARALNHVVVTVTGCHAQSGSTTLAFPCDTTATHHFENPLAPCRMNRNTMRTKRRRCCRQHHIGSPCDRTAPDHLGNSLKNPCLNGWLTAHAHV